jgi:hypothetical protein
MSESDLTVLDLDVLHEKGCLTQDWLCYSRGDG